MEPLRIATQELGKTVGLLFPVPNPAPQLQAVPTFVRHIREAELTGSQFPDPVPLADGTTLARLATWI